MSWDALIIIEGVLVGGGLLAFIAYEYWSMARDQKKRRAAEEAKSDPDGLEGR